MLHLLLITIDCIYFTTVNTIREKVLFIETMPLSFVNELIRNLEKAYNELLTFEMRWRYLKETWIFKKNTTKTLAYFITSATTCLKCRRRGPRWQRSQHTAPWTWGRLLFREFCPETISRSSSCTPATGEPDWHRIQWGRGRKALKSYFFRFAQFVTFANILCAVSKF